MLIGNEENWYYSRGIFTGFKGKVIPKYVTDYIDYKYVTYTKKHVSNPQRQYNNACHKMFYKCENLEKVEGIEDWDVSEIKSFYAMFSDISFNQDLSSWNIKYK